MSDRSDSFDLATVASLLLFVFLIIKVYGVAGFSLTTATGLISAQPLSVLIGSISLYAYACMAFLAIFLLWLLMLGLQNRNSTCRRYAPLIFVLMILAILLSPGRYLVDAIACTVLACLIALVPYFLLNRDRYSVSNASATGGEGRRLRKLYARLADCNARPRFHAIVLTVILIELMAFVLATISKPWVPAELVTLSSRVAANPVHPNISQTSKPIVFIIDESNGRVTMLMDEDRYLISVPEGLIKQRMICHLEDQFSGANPLLETIFGQAYQPHDLACWHHTDQPLEYAKQTPPLWVRVLQWQF
jgi:hypothetical protein